MSTENAEDIRIPDGKGGWTTTKAKRIPGSSRNADKADKAMTEAQEKDFFVRVGTFTEHLNKVVQRYGRDYNLTAAELAAGVFLENCNIRNTFPDGPPEHDKICEAVAFWFEENKNK